MATNLLTFQPPGIRACATSNTTGNKRRTSDSDRQKSSSSANWWSPIFGWSSDADYIDGKSTARLNDDQKKEPAADENRSRFSPGCFTEEKARQLRLMTKESESFHDAMYHSAIASRLASDLPKRNSAD